MFQKFKSMFLGRKDEQTKMLTRDSLTQSGNKYGLDLKPLQMKIFKFANNVDTNEAAHHEPSHLGLHCLLLSL